MATKLDVRCAAIVFRGRKMLVIGGDEFYTFPGGGAEARERLDACVEREVFEETNQRIKVTGLMYVQDYMPKRGRCLNILFMGKLVGAGRAHSRNNPDHEEENEILCARWIDIDELAKLDFRPKRILRDIIKRKLWEKGIENSDYLMTR